jgi:hypothetical protein
MCAHVQFCMHVYVDRLKYCNMPMFVISVHKNKCFIYHSFINNCGDRDILGGECMLPEFGCHHKEGLRLKNGR